MPKPLATVPTTSAVARLLDAAAVSGAVDPRPAPERDPNPEKGEVPRARRRAHPVKREVVLTEHTAEVLDVLVERLRAATRTRLSASHMLRAMITAVEPALSAVEVEVASSGPWRLPANGEQHDADRAEFERRMADAILAALHKRHWP